MIKKVLVLVLAFCMVLSVSVFASGEADGPSDGFGGID